MKNKDLDCVEIKNMAQTELQKELAGLSEIQKRDYFAQSSLRLKQKQQSLRKEAKQKSAKTA